MRFMLLPNAGATLFTRCAAVNAARCVLLSLDTSASHGEIFNCGDDDQYSLAQWADIVLRALGNGKPVVTANKALLSAHGEELFEAAQRAGTNLYYEASVAGGIPIIKVLREGLIGNRITRLYGIVNGTCNYILTLCIYQILSKDMLSTVSRISCKYNPCCRITSHVAKSHCYYIDCSSICNVSGNVIFFSIDNCPLAHPAIEHGHYC